MIKEYIPYWEKNKGKLENYLKTTKQDCYDSYEELVRLIFMIVINPEMPYQGYSLNDIHTIDDGHYQGTQIFLAHIDWYQPDIRDYVLASVSYGSCSGCDTLLSISQYSGGYPDAVQVSEYMTLCLHLFQSMQFLKEESACCN